MWMNGREILRLFWFSIDHVHGCVHFEWWSESDTAVECTQFITYLYADNLWINSAVIRNASADTELTYKSKEFVTI